MSLPEWVTPGLEQRLLDKLMPEPNTGCWYWTGSLGGAPPNDYGILTIGRRTIRAHRAIWMVMRGPIPDGLQVLHHCDTPRCCCWYRCLFLGTPMDNVRDMDQKGRRVTVTRRGEDAVNVKLTDLQVAEIRRRRETGAYLWELADEYGISATHVHRICRGFAR